MVVGGGVTGLACAHRCVFETFKRIVFLSTTEGLRAASFAVGTLGLTACILFVCVLAMSHSFRVKQGEMVLKTLSSWISWCE